MIALYPNTQDVRRHLGLENVDPDYILGDETAMFILHDPVKGTFTYIDPEKDITDAT